ncbi:MAG: S8 family serine peptidase [Promethearchaeota archaeon]
MSIPLTSKQNYNSDICEEFSPKGPNFKSNNIYNQSCHCKILLNSNNPADNIQNNFLSDKFTKTSPPDANGETEINFGDMTNLKNMLGLDEIYTKYNLSGKGVTVAVMDTGISPYHEVFAHYLPNNSLYFGDKIVAYYDAIHDIEINTQTYHENNATSEIYKIEDKEGHGTHVSSILAGDSTNSIDPYKGIAYNAKIVFVKIFIKNEIDGTLYTNESIIIRGLNWLIDHKEQYNISIVSMSFGDSNNTDGSDEISLLVDKMAFNGILPVIAAGNWGQYGYWTIGQPACARSALVVGGIDNDGDLFYKSSRGPCADGRIKPDVLAPSIHILGAYIPRNNSYKYITGTSQATPIVAGIAALIKEYMPQLPPFKIKQLILIATRQTSLPSIFTQEDSFHDNDRGWGMVRPRIIMDLLNDSRVFEDSEFFLNRSFENGANNFNNSFDRTYNNNLKGRYSNSLNGSINNDGIIAFRLKLKAFVPYLFKINTTDIYLIIYSINYSVYGDPVVLSFSVNNPSSNYAEAFLYLVKSQVVFFTIKLNPKIGFIYFEVSSLFLVGIHVSIISLFLIIGVVYISLYLIGKKINNLF